MKNPWVPVCQECWYILNPDQYAPTHPFNEGETCFRCGQITCANIHVRPPTTKKYKAILFAPDGDWVTDYEADSVQAVWDKVNDGGSRWIFYPIPAVILSRRHWTSPTQHIIDAPDEFEELRGRSVSTFGRYLRMNQEYVAALLSTH